MNLSPFGRRILFGLFFVTVVGYWGVNTIFATCGWIDCGSAFWCDKLKYYKYGDGLYDGYKYSNYQGQCLCRGSLGTTRVMTEYTRRRHANLLGEGCGYGDCCTPCEQTVSSYDLAYIEVPRYNCDD